MLWNNLFSRKIDMIQAKASPATNWEYCPVNSAFFLCLQEILSISTITLFNKVILFVGNWCLPLDCFFSVRFFQISTNLENACSSSWVLYMWMKVTYRNHRIIECFELKETFEGHLVQICCNEQGHLSLDQADQSPVQPDHECYQGRDIYHFHHNSPCYKVCPCLCYKTPLSTGRAHKVS